MIKKTIGIATILLLLLVIVLVGGVSSSRANTGLLELQSDVLPDVELNQVGDFDSGLLVNNVRLEQVFQAVPQRDVLEASAHGLLRFKSLQTVRRQVPVVALESHTLNSLASVYGNDV